MDLTVAREIDTPTVISDEVGGETLAVNLATGAYYVVPESSRSVWQALASGVPAMELLDHPDDPRAAGLTAYVESLVTAGLLRETDHRAPAPVIAWTAEGLSIEEHTDMADLLGLDPIHEADENVGWPKRRTEN